MLNKALIAIATLAWAAPAAAQERGTMEFGAFGSAATFNNDLSLKTGYGGGGRIGMFLDRHWAIEFEDAEMRASRPNGLKNVNVGILSGRLVVTPFPDGALTFHVGAGAGGSTETNFLHSYGVSALLGAKLALTENASLRLDGLVDWLEEPDLITYKSLHFGISLFRRPGAQVRTVTTMMPAPMMTMAAHEDSVSASETRRLRERDAAFRALRDSLRNAPVAHAPSPATVAAMEARIHFAFDKSELTDSARAILDEKVAIFRANPDLSIDVVGYTDVTGSDAYNMALGTRRADATKAYIVSQGIAANRIITDSKGERQQITNSAGAKGEAPNRRAIFRLVISSDRE